MTKEQLQEDLDHKFRQLFQDRTQEGFKVTDSITIKFVRGKSLKQSKIEVYEDNKLWFPERLGRFKTYKYFLNTIVLRLEFKVKNS